MESTQKLRLFTAVFPPPEIVQQLRQVEPKFSAVVGGRAIRWPAPDQIHLTLNFLGGVEIGRVPLIEAAMQAVCQQSAACSLAVTGSGCFPDSQHPKIIWAGLAGELVLLEALKKALDRALEPIGYAPEDRPFLPHLTLARVARLNALERRRVGEVIALLRETQFGQWRVERVELMQSVLLPTGAKYTALRSFPLGKKVTPG
jgi:2'-5' RNA ligase